MACERCIDIHKAQNIGATSSPCECDCHVDSNSVSSTDKSVSFINYNVDCGTDTVKIEADGTFTVV